jgi:hypothetical protein
MFKLFGFELENLDLNSKSFSVSSLRSPISFGPSSLTAQPAMVFFLYFVFFSRIEPTPAFSAHLDLLTLSSPTSCHRRPGWCRRASPSRAQMEMK